MLSNNVISLKIGNKIIFQHPLTQLNKLAKKNSIKNKRKLNNDIKLKINFDSNNLNKEYEQRLINEERLLKKMMQRYFSKEKQNFIKEISKEEIKINNLNLLVEKSKNNDTIKFKEMLDILNKNKEKNKENIKLNLNKNNILNDKKQEILNEISLNKKLFADILCLNKNNIIINNNNLNYIKENQTKENDNFIQIINRRDNKKGNVDNINNNINKTEPNKIRYKKIFKIKEEQIESFRNFVGNSKLSDRIIISYFDIEHPDIKTAAKKYFKSKYGTDEITLLYIYHKNPKDIIYHKFKLISEVNELFIVAKKENLNAPRLFLKNGTEIKNNRKIKCIGALNLDNNNIIKII